MKTIPIVGLIIIYPLLLAAQTPGPAAAASASSVPASTPYTVVSRGANSAVWQRQTYGRAPDGTVVTNIHRYVELATGLNHLVGGRWMPSSDQIKLSPDGTSAAATNGQAQAYFPGNIYNGVIKLVTPDGKVLRSQPIGLSYSDGSNSVLLAVVTNATGAILPSGNQVIYTNAFDGLDADLLYTYTKAGFEQNVILREQPPQPSSFGLNPATTRLQVLTEFFHPPQPRVSARMMPTAAGSSENDSLRFGRMWMGQGKAFLVGQRTPSVGVNKRWRALQGRQFLIEEVPIVSIAKDIDSLRPFVSQAGVGPKPVVSKNLIPPPQQLANTAARTPFLTQATLPNHGLVLDYQMLNGTLTNYTFQGDTTYYISGRTYSWGTNTFEGGTVLKFATNGSLSITPGAIGTPRIKWLAGPYRPVVFTAKDDNTVGATITGSTGNPTGYYGNPMLMLAGFSPGTPLTDLRMAYAKTAIAFGGAGNPRFYNVQFVNCENGLRLAGASVFLGNALFANTVTNFIFQGGAAVTVEHATISGSLFLATSTPTQSGSTLLLTNCILANVTNLFSGVFYVTNADYNGIYNSPRFGSDQVPDSSYPFQTVGGGSYYLADDSPFLNAGTTNIDPALLADLQTKTTYPPIVYSNDTFTTAQTFNPQAQRDTDTPDLGYHYDPVDYFFGGCIADSNLTFAAGTAVGWFQLPGSGGPGYGIALADDVTATFNGTVTSPCVLARYDTIQEGADGLWTDLGWLGGITCRYPGNSFSMSAAPQIVSRFTHFYELAGDPHAFRDYWTPLIAHVNDCEFYGNGAGTYDNAYYFTNCLFDYATSGQIQGYNSADAFVLQNCTIRGSTLNLQPNYNPIPIVVHDCSFDDATLNIQNYATNSTYASYDYNAFTNGATRFPIGGSHDITNFTSFNWQSSWFGNYYLPPDSPLIDKGDVTANLVGLYHFTTQTNQTIEANSTVDIGYHYVATDANGNPLDSNGDGVPDYLEDANGNGIVDDGETNWALAILTQPQTQTVSQGANVTFNLGAEGVAPLSYQWYFNGTNIAWATNSTLGLTNVQPADEGSYFTVVSNFSGSLTSSVAYLVLTCTPAPSGLVGWWRGESNTLDSAGPNDGYLSNGVSYTAGKIGTTFSFNGTNGFVLIPDSPLLDLTNLTIGAWVKFSSLDSVVTGNAPAGDQYVVFKQNSRRNYFEGYSLLKQRHGNYDSFSFQVSSASAVAVEATSTQAIQTNVWYYLAAVRGSNYIQLFINGQLAAQAEVGFPQNYGFTPLYFGTSGQYHWNGMLAGSLDEVELYNRALSSNEIQEIYNAQLSGIHNCFVPPLIVSQPSSQLVKVGTTATLMVSAAGSPPLSYQWSFNGTNIAGATNAILLLPNIQSTNTGNYSVVVSNNEGTVSSSNAFLDVETCFSAADVVLVIDDSDTMSDQFVSGTQTEELTAARIAATNIVESLNFTNDQAALYSFRDNVTTNQTLTNNLPELLTAIASLTNATGNLSMGNALQIAQGELASPRHQPDALPVMVFVSEGPDIPYESSNVIADSSNVVLGVATRVKAAGTRLITITIEDLNTSFMAQIADSPSDAYCVTDVSQLTNICNLIAASIRCEHTNSPEPSVQIVSPVNQTLLARSNVVISATATNAATGAPIQWVEFFDNSTNSLGFAVTNSSNGFYQINWFPVTGGTNVLTALAMDANSNSAWSSPVTNYVRNLPAVTITSPTNGQIFQLVSPMDSTNITISATAVPDGAGVTITNVAFYHDGILIGATNGDSPYVMLWTNAPIGTNSLTVKATDSTGATGISYPVNVIVEPTNHPPYVYPGPDQTNYLPYPVSLNGIVSDDGLPSNYLAVAWSRISGPGNVHFDNSNQPMTTATFTQPGTNVLQLTAKDGQWIVSSNATITVLPTNYPPVPNAGTNQIIIWPALANTNPLPVIALNKLVQLPEPAGIDYFPASNSLIVSLEDNMAHTFETISFDGTTNPFSSISNLTDEVYITAARNSLGGFTNGEMFTGDGHDGEILRIEPDGTTIGTNGTNSNAWVVLPSIKTNGTTIYPGLLRGGLWVDRTGVWGGDLIVVTLDASVTGDYTPDGFVWRINSSGQATFVAQVNASSIYDTFEGVTTCPNDPAKYGPWAGKILVGGDNPGDFFAVDTNGFVTRYNFPFGAEDIRVIPENETFYGIIQGGSVYGAPASEFEGMVGDILVADEYDDGALYRIHWDGTNFDTYQLIQNGEGTPAWEGANFAPAGLSNMAPSVVQLDGFVSDPDHELFTPTSNYWSEVGGPAPVAFGDPTQTNTTVEFSTNGIYVFQLSAFDGQYTNNSYVTNYVIRNTAPTITNLTNLVIGTTSTNLSCIVKDDGWPSNQLTLNWSVVSSNGPVNLGWTNETTNNTNVVVDDAIAFTNPGTYVLMLTASDGQASSLAEVTIIAQTNSLTLSPAYGPPTCTNVPYTVKARLLDPIGLPITNTTIYFSAKNVDGDFGGNNVNGTAITSNNGTAFFTYTNMSSFAGRDAISAYAYVGNNQIYVQSTTNVYKAWALPLECGASYQEEVGEYGSRSKEWPGFPADYYVFSGTNNDPVHLTLVQDSCPMLMLLRDPSGQEVAENSMNYTTTYSVTTLNYTPATNGDFILEVLPIFDEQNAQYDLSLSCPGGMPALPDMQVLYNGTNVPKGVTVVFPTTSLTNPVNITLNITNAGDASFTLLGVGTNGDFTLTNDLTALPWTFDPGYSTNVGLVFNASTNGVSFGGLVLATNASGGDYIVYLEGNTFSTNATPVVRLVSPTNDSTYIDDSADGIDTYIPFTATVAQGGNTPIEYVDLAEVTTNDYISDFIPNVMLALDANTLAYTNAVSASNLGGGDVSVVAIAQDGNGNTLAISQPILIHVIPYDSHSSNTVPQMQLLYDDTNVPSGGTIVFPQTLPGVTTNVSLTITNPGTAELDIPQMQWSGNFYPTNSSLNSIIPPGGSAHFEMVFTAAASGVNPGELTINNNASSGGAYVANLVGYAYLPGQGPSTGSNQPPVAVDDQFTVLANSVNNPLYPLTNDYDLDGDALTIISIDTNGTYGSVSIINNGSAISYSPPPGARGVDGFNYEISDGQGGTAKAQALITVYGTDKPTVNIISPPSGYTTNAGQLVPIVASVSPSQYVTNVAFYQGKVLIGQLSEGYNGLYTNYWQAVANPCGCGFYAQAMDSFGQETTSPEISINVTTNGLQGSLTASLDSVVDADGSNSLNSTNLITIRDGFFNLYGRAFHSLGSNVVWQLGVYSQDGTTLLRNLTPASTGAVGTDNTSGILVTNCDVTTLQNGVYDLKLTVTGGYQMASADVQFILDSNVKLGQFSFSQQDLVIPVNGIPLTVTRTYNSLNPDKGDFGYGWTFAINSMDVALDESREDVEDDISGGSTYDSSGGLFSMRTSGGRDVTLTLPNGQRTTFYFYLTRIDDFDYRPAWQAAPGVTAKLGVQGSPIANGIIGQLTWSEADNGSWNVPNDYFDFKGFVLTNQDGTVYYIDRQDMGQHNYGGGDWVAETYGAPYLSKIIERNGDTINISSSSIVYTSSNSVVQRTILIQRNADGLISAITDPNGASGGPPAVLYQYDNNDNLIAVEHLVDRYANGGQGTYVTNSFTYTNADFPHYITSIINGDNTQVAENFYNSSGQLTKVQDANGNTTHFFHHDPTNNMEVVVDRLGNTNTYVYDARGNVIAQTNALGEVTTMAYDNNNNKTNQITYLPNGVPYATNSYAYNDLNLMVSSTDPLDHTSTFAYDAYGDLTNSVDANGNGTTNTYDGSGNLLTTSDALGDTTTNYYNNGLLTGSSDALGNITTNYYDSTNNLVAAATLDASDDILTSNTFTYDANGNRLTSTVWRQESSGNWIGATTTNVYDAMNRVIETIAPDGGTNTVDYNFIGQQAATVDPLGHTNTYIYDSQGRLKETIYPDGTTTKSVYDANGNRIQSIDQEGRVTTYQYDALNRLTNTIYADLTASSTIYDALGRVAETIDGRGIITAFAYDSAGRRVAVTNALGTAQQTVPTYTYDANGNRITFTDADGHTTTNVYDALNRQIETIYPNDTTHSVGYDAAGRRVAVTNQDGIVTLFGYDGAGRLTSVTNAANTGQSTVTRYEYDQAGNEVAQIDALSRTNTFAYDGMGRRISHTLPDETSIEGFAYDLDGNLINHTNFDGAIIANQYDAMNRLTNSSSSGGKTYSINHSYTYTPTGQRQNMVDDNSYYGSVTIYYSYDNRDRLTQKVVDWNSSGFDLDASLYYGYDADGHVTNLHSSWAYGVDLTYRYDDLNRLTNVLSHGQLAAGYSYDPAGNLVGMQYGNGVTNAYQYDRLNRLTNLTWRAGSSPVASFAYQLMAGGTQTNVVETFTNGTPTITTWSYDNLYRLTNENIGAIGDLGYAYDVAGNRISRSSNGTSQDYVYNADDELITNANSGGVPNQFDSDGNEMFCAQKNVGYVYDGLNRLVEGTTNYGNDSICWISYDAAGNRVEKSAGNITTYYLVDDRNPSGYPQVVEEYHESGSGEPTTLYRVYNYGLGLISQEQIDTNSWLPSAISYYGYDGHGNVRFLMDTNGVITDTYTYDAFGNLIASHGDTPNNYLYCGQQFDPDLGLYYNRARYLSTDTGRFWSRDSYAGNNEDPLSLHKYLYGEDNPVNNVDPSGHDSLDMVLDVANICAGICNFFSFSEAIDGTTSSAGPDVTAALDSTLQDVDTTFHYTWNLDQKKAAAYQMRDLKDVIFGHGAVGNRGGAAGAWDILPLAYAGFEHYPPYYLSCYNRGSAEYICGSGSTPKGATVTFNGECYYAGSVNYALWGKMNRLVHDWLQSQGKSSAKEYDLDNALHTMASWKHFHYGDYGLTEYEAEEFTRFGYNGSIPTDGMPCPSTPVKMKESQFVNWCWEPSKPREY